MILIRVPCSSANLGPGFDVIGLALSIWLELQVTVNPSISPTLPFNCALTFEGQGAGSVSLKVDHNLVTRAALYVLRCHGKRVFPPETRVHIINPIPFGRGLGSSAAAVVAGVLLGNEVGELGLSKERILDYCLMIERHPDNVAAALYGGFVGTYLNELDPSDTERKEIPLSEVLPEPAGGLDTGLQPPHPPFNIGHYKKFRWAPEIKAIAIIPDFEVSTALARDALPLQYSRQDMVFNLQRIALLTTSLGESPPDPDMIYHGMQDKVHQSYRQMLIPGLGNILKSITPKMHPGLLGICLSGAGPTILALATSNFEDIANAILFKFKECGITCDWKVLEPALDGATVSITEGTQERESLTYASAGVSIDAGNLLVERIKTAVRSTKRLGADAEIGGFGGTFDLESAGYGSPLVLLGAIDGVGTKLKIAQAVGKHDTVGIDLVAMNVNDLVVQGGEALFFLDCYSCSKLNIENAADFVNGVAEGCRLAGCALIGGETAEMPGLFSGSDYDVVGAAVGAVNRNRILPDTKNMVAGDILLGLASNGVHSNGFSLVRKILEHCGHSYSSPAPWDTTTTIGISLLTPTRIYVKPLLQLLEQNLIKGMSHITGGGLIENIPRMLPTHLAAKMDATAWEVPAVLQWLKNCGDLSSKEFARTFNTGLGMVLVVSENNASKAILMLQELGESVSKVGMLVNRDLEGCILENLEKWD
ncbi:MAG: hypothetical protein M1829_005990 [Trizodia sp. TS-e1964]|nr:MAG: hypothetical protein M1829_005990 [Trizodia sp. TS-e1964]